MSTCHTPLLPFAGIGSRSHLGFETTVRYFCSRLLRTALFSSSKVFSGGTSSGYKDVSPMSINPVSENKTVWETRKKFSKSKTSQRTYKAADLCCQKKTVQNIHTLNKCWSLQKTACCKREFQCCLKIKNTKLPRKLLQLPSLACSLHEGYQSTHCLVPNNFLHHRTSLLEQAIEGIAKNMQMRMWDTGCENWTDT